MPDNQTTSFDLRIFGVTLILIGVGVAFMYGASARYGERLLLDRAYFFNRQLIYGLMSVPIIIFVSKINPNTFFRLANTFFLMTLFSLAIVLIPSIGTEINGARRWIDLGLFNFQPSELAKITFIIYISKLLAVKENQLKSFKRGLFPFLMLIGIVFILIFVEEDFSTAILLLIVSLNLIFIAGASFKHFLYLGITGIPVLYFAVTSFGHMKARLYEYLKKYLVHNYVTYQEKQAVKAIENANIFGNGLGIGSYHAKIPEAHTDFYFPSIVADVGLVGGIIVILLFFYLFIKNFKIAYHLKENKFFYLISGLTLVIFWQVILNLGSVLGLLPIAGLPLPFLSFGGNSLMSGALSIGIILSISRYESNL